MSAVRDIAINVVAYPITFLMGLFGHRALNSFKLRGDRKLWKPFLGGGSLAIILTDKPGQNTPKVSVTEVQAFSDLRSVLKSLGKEVDLQIGSAANFQHLMKRRFVCLGGPKANPATKYILDSLPNLPVTFDHASNGFKTAAGGPFIEVKDANGLNTITDYGLIVKLSKLDKNATDSCPALIVFGLRGAGTQDAVRAILTNSPLRKFMAENRDRDYYVLLQFNKNNATDPCMMKFFGTF